MKVLIIDDEKLTREGLLHGIDWDSLHISEVLLADDGIKGLGLAQIHHPEIILSDIRMPRMDGIQMAERIHEFLPDTCIIFMSGYSDKEYLKAAIRLKAISYVEKPINPKEVEDAIVQSIHNIEISRHAKHSQISHQRKQNSQLAIFLTQKEVSNTQDILALTSSLDFAIKDNSWFTTCIIKFQTLISSLDPEAVKLFHQEFSQFLSKYNLHEFHAYKNDHYLIIHICGKEKTSEYTLQKCCSFLQSKAASLSKFFIAMGKTVCGLEKVYESYIPAVILLQSSFFSEYNEIITKQEPKTDSILLKDQVIPFAAALSERNLASAQQIADTLFVSLKNCQTLLPSQVKDIYYKYFIQIQKSLTNHQVGLSKHNQQISESIWETISQCNTLKELHTLLSQRLAMIFEHLENAGGENSIIFQIKEFICSNYPNETLSVKDISEHVYRSSSYVCTLFKNETGETLNQYLTEYRLEMAKHLLCDPLYKIADISAKVGYSDGNYFGKIFKKLVGLSPSEYREKMLK